MCTTSCLFSLLIFSTLIPTPSWNRDYAQALVRAEAAKKPVAVFIGSGADGWIGVSEEGQLSLEVRRLLAEHYICVYLDASRSAEERVVRSFDAGQSPLVVLSSRNRAYQAYRHSGKIANASLAQVLQRHASQDTLEVYDELMAIRPAVNVSPERFYIATPCRT